MYAATPGDPVTSGQLVNHLNGCVGEHVNGFFNGLPCPWIEPVQLSWVANHQFMIAHDGWDVAPADFRQNRLRFGAVSDTIPEADRLIDVKRSHIGQYGFKRFIIAMNVGNKSDFHWADKIVLSMMVVVISY
jgi:hypothetical protein